MDEMWIHQFTPVIKEQSKDCIEMRESCPKEARAGTGVVFFHQMRHFH